MRINSNQPGENTFHRLKIIRVFDKKYADYVQEDMIQELKKIRPFGIWSYNSLRHFWLIGSYLNYEIYVRLYRDGFHIEIKTFNSKDLSQNLTKYLFNDLNNQSIWTKDYNKIVPIVKQICKELREYTKIKEKIK